MDDAAAAVGRRHHFESSWGNHCDRNYRRHRNLMRRTSRTLRGSLAALTVLVVGGCAGNASVAACIAPLASEVVPADGALFGINPDWANQTLEQFTESIGQRPSVAVSFADVPMTETDTQNVLAAGEQVARNGGVLLLTLEPKGGLDTVTPEVSADVANVLAQIEGSGTAVIVRFAHEMNGSWYPWGQQPAEYVAAFRTFSEALTDYGSSAAMMWAPNYGGGYPFVGSAFEAEPGTDAFVTLDTNADGVLTTADDPYAPYYPGDDVVDWVGMSLYHWGSTYPWGENEMPEEGKFAQQLTGQYNGLGGNDIDVPDFYTVYGVDKLKPVAIPETAALVVPRGDAEGELAIKRAWWQQVLAEDTAATFPQLRMINWFEWHKFEPEIGEDVDWSITSDAATRDAFVADLPSWARFASKPPECSTVEQP
jgi:hypothetical protein